MEQFTRAELTWIVQTVVKAAMDCRLAEHEAGTKLERELARLRAEQLTGVAEKLNKALENGDKRMAIR